LEKEKPLGKGERRLSRKEKNLFLIALLVDGLTREQSLAKALTNSSQDSFGKPAPLDVSLSFERDDMPVLTVKPRV
jgi:hypothetical protein